MAIMNYITPGITKIDFEDSLFVLTDVGRDYTKDVQAFIESRGGIVKGAVTKATNYLIYGDGEEETTKYKKALELINDNGLEINVLPLSLFCIDSRGQGLVEFGMYPFDEDGTQKPIKWSVLKKDAKRALLISSYGLNNKSFRGKLEGVTLMEAYHSKNKHKREGVTWETCALRKWLNEEFYNTAFSEDEKKRICTTKVKNADHSKYHTPGGCDTEDRIFLLSIREVKKYLPTEMERRIVPTPYAVKQGAQISEWYKTCWWWLRSPGEYPVDAVDVQCDGIINNEGSDVDLYSLAVCPALWVELE